MAFPARARLTWRLRSRTLALGERTFVMGILNVTPDSFSDGGAFFSVERAVEQARAMLTAGAEILDIGGESTRPGASAISPDEEQQRVLPVIEAILRAQPQAILSVDTYHAQTARAAVKAGAEIVNDVSGLTWDTDMAATCAELQSGVIAMHARGKPQEWRTLPPLADAEVVPLVLRELRERIESAVSSGVDRERIAIDPGLGFGKILDENWPLLAGMNHLQELGLPIISGASRKRFLAKAVAARRGGEEPAASARLHSTTAANVAAIFAGAHVLRVHDVEPAVEAAAVADAVLAGNAQ